MLCRRRNVWVEESFQLALQTLAFTQKAKISAMAGVPKWEKEITQALHKTDYPNMLWKQKCSFTLFSRFSCQKVLLVWNWAFFSSQTFIFLQRLDLEYFLS